MFNDFFDFLQKNKKLWLISVIFFLRLSSIIIFNNAFADFEISGEDHSAALTEANDMVATVLGFLKKTVAPALSCVCVLGGIYRCSKKRYEDGVPMIIFGVALMFIEKLMNMLSKLFG